MDSVDDFLEHYGTKGMKWGVRNGPVSAAGYIGTGIVRVQNATGDTGSTLASFVANAHNYLTSAKVYPKLGTDMKKLSQNYTSDDLAKLSVREDYLHKARKIMETHLNSGLPKGLTGTVLSNPMYPRNPYYVVGNKAGVKGEVGTLLKEGLKHRETNSEVAIFKLNQVMDSQGYILSVTLGEISNNLEQSDFTDDFLEHYGTRGMKWGVRKKSSPRPAFMPPVKTSSGTKPKWQSPPPKKTVPAVVPQITKISRFGKKKSPKVLSEEAQEFRNIRLKAKRNGVQSLTNKDLEAINKRLELQSKYNKAFPKPKSPLSIASELVINSVLTDAGEKNLGEFIGSRSPDAMVMVRNALLLARAAKTVKKK